MHRRLHDKPLPSEDTERRWPWRADSRVRAPCQANVLSCRRVSLLIPPPARCPPPGHGGLPNAEPAETAGGVAGRRAPRFERARPEMTRSCCSAWLDEEAKLAWKLLLPQLERMDVLTRIDGNALARYCQLWAH